MLQSKSELRQYEGQITKKASEVEILQERVRQDSEFIAQKEELVKSRREKAAREAREREQREVRRAAEERATALLRAKQGAQTAVSRADQELKLAQTVRRFLKLFSCLCEITVMC
jgi:hypothetical protein